MTKKLDVSQKLLDFSGVVINDGTTDFTLKNAILTYLNNVQYMNLRHDDVTKLYSVGIKVGAATGEVELDQAEYDALKRMVDDGQVTKSQQQPMLMFGIVIVQQVRDLVNNATNIA